MLIHAKWNVKEINNKQEQVREMPKGGGGVIVCKKRKAEEREDDNDVIIMAIRFDRSDAIVSINISSLEDLLLFHYSWISLIGLGITI